MRSVRWVFLYALLIALSALALCHAACSPLLPHDDPAEQREFSNLYQAACFPQISTGTAQNFTVIRGSIPSSAIFGTATNDSAPLGRLGEAQSVSQGSFVNCPASGVNGDVTTFDLTAGDWLVTGCTTFGLNGATMTGGGAGVGTSAGDVNPTHRQDILPPTATANNSICNTERILLSATTTVRLKFQCNYSAGTPRAFGYMEAWRTR